MNLIGVHIVATVFWGVFGIAIGTLALVYNNFSGYVMVSLVTAIIGNSVHLVSLSASKTALTEASAQEVVK